MTTRPTSKPPVRPGSTRLTQSRSKRALRRKGIGDFEWRYRPGDWIEVTVDRDKTRHHPELCVVGLDDHGEIVTAAGRLGPRESSLVLKGWGFVSQFRSTRPEIGSRSEARTAVHALRAFYGLTACEATVAHCGCEYPLGDMWRWFDACEALVLEGRTVNLVAAQ